ncbi:hypothetical protein FisN_35Hh014 [Fistulifera solaris]|uniref:Uncharacterized protein n=1 Tax=Fistulifera solaris TaxID=1519565 RepID=A0A1Z5JQM2_FISSO|nr:hypothetical protein FisN_35Hh014 [Fistulifera solaris]|eukprot:GAX16315.1 hypothetical protein FisN_35Hh014 [Fistulifera solaris]
MFRFATTFLLTTLLAVNAMEISTEGSVPLDSAMGQALLRKATVIEPARHLNQNNQNQGNAAYLGKYEIKYLGCNSLIQLNREAGNNQNEGILYTQHLVRFALCPANSCNSCNGGGEYAVNMAEFVDAYTEAKLSEEAYACEMARENCVCDNADDAEACESACYSNAGLTNCAQAEGEAEFQIQRYLECREIEGGNNNNANNENGNQYYNGNNNGQYYGNLYVGPYCANNGKSIHLGVFYDNTCTNKASNNLYSARTGSNLPFTSQSIIKTSGCMSCRDTQNNNNNQNQQVQNEDGSYEEVYAVTDLCTQSYQSAVKCETKMAFANKDTSGCEFLGNVLPRLTSASKSSGVYGGGRNGAAKAFAWIFAMTTIAFGAYSYFLYRKIKRGSQSLVAGGNLA